MTLNVTNTQTTSVFQTFLLFFLSFACTTYATSEQSQTSSYDPLSYSFYDLIGECIGGKNKERHHLRNKDIALLNQLSHEYTAVHPVLFVPPDLEQIEEKIPKKIHFIWVGPKPFPEESVENLASWRKYNPDWELHFWTDSDERPLPLPDMIRRRTQDYDFAPVNHLIPKTTNWGEKSDLMRAAILFNEGGFYADHDAECLQSFSPFLSHFTFVVCLERPHYHTSIDSSVIPANGLFGCMPGHIILQKSMERVLEIWDIIEQKFPESDPKSNFQRVLQRTFDSFAYSTIRWRNQGTNQDLILPTAYFYPDKTFTKKKIQELNNAGITFSSHKFAGAWRKNLGKASDDALEEYTEIEMRYLQWDPIFCR